MDLDTCTFRVIDTETTGLDATDRVCEIAWTDVDASGELHGSFTSLINPGVPMKPGASATHHLTDEDVAHAPPMESVVDAMCAGMSNGAKAYAAHNAEFDQGKLFLSGYPFLCTMRLAKHVLPEQESYSSQFLRYQLKLKPDIPNGTPAHRAAADVSVTVALLLYLLPLARSKWPEVTTVEALIDKVKQPRLLTTIGFTKYKGQPYRSLDAGMLRWIITNCSDREDDVHTARSLLSGGRA